MVVRARSIALLAIAASPLSAYGAVDSYLFFQPTTPTFNCYPSTAGGTIDWGDGVSLQPTLGLSTTESKLEPSSSPLDCSNSSFAHSFSGDTGYNMFSLKFEDKWAPSTDFTLKLDSFTVQSAFTESIFATDFLKGGNTIFHSLWDVTLDYLKYDSAGNVVGDHKDFVGIYVNSDFKWVTDASLKLDNGELLFDPTIPDPNAVVGLYDTPQTPEPGTLVLLGTGLAGIGGIVRRRLGW